jgi:hypothetical protein
VAEADLEPVLARVAARFRSELASRGRGQLGAPQYLAFSDALTGHSVARLRASSARGGAVMMSVAVPTGALRLLDNVMLVGEPDDLGADPDEDELD